MNCDRITLMMSAALDNELSPAERAEFDAHLANCAACHNEWAELRVLDNSMKAALTSPVPDVPIDRIMEASVRKSDSPSVTIVKTEHTKSSRERGRPVIVLGMLATVVMAGLVIFQLSAEARPVGEVTMATGPLEMKRPNAREWVTLDASSHTILPENVRIRTRETSLCEIRTKADALVRLNCETELLLRCPEKLELISGELWCRTSSRSSIEISTEKVMEAPPMAFTCPADCETQWQSKPNHELACTAISSSPIDLQIERPHEVCTVKPGEAVSFASGQPPVPAGHSDQTNATSWQLPLLIRKKPDDQELQQRLVSILAKIGQTKVRHLSEQQLRQLGPAGTVPLLKFVGSAESLQSPRLRYNAMTIIADLAPPAAIGELEELLQDDDQTIRELALQALRRLDPDRK